MSNIPEEYEEPTHVAPEAHEPSTAAAAEAQEQVTDLAPQAQDPLTDTAAAPEAQEQITDVAPQAQGASTDTVAAPKAQEQIIDVAPQAQGASTDTVPAPKAQAPITSLAPPAQKQDIQIAPPTTSLPEQVTPAQNVGFQHRVKKWSDTWLPLLVFLVIVFQAVIMYRQTQTMDRQTAISDKQTVLMEKSERAYVGVATVKTDLKRREILVMLQNIGHVPASSLSIQGQQIRSTSEKKDPNGGVFRWDPGAVELFPGTQMPVSISLEGIEQSELDAISNKTKILFIGGTIHYNNGFGSRETTTFAFQYDPTLDRWTPHSELSKFFQGMSR